VQGTRASILDERIGTRELHFPFAGSYCPKGLDSLSQREKITQGTKGRNDYAFLFHPA